MTAITHFQSSSALSPGSLAALHWRNLFQLIDLPRQTSVHDFRLPGIPYRIEANSISGWYLKVLGVTLPKYYHGTSECRRSFRTAIRDFISLCFYSIAQLDFGELTLPWNLTFPARWLPCLADATKFSHVVVIFSCVDFLVSSTQLIYLYLLGVWNASWIPSESIDASCI